MPETSPTEFGALRERVDNLRDDVSELKSDIKGLSEKVQGLTDVVNKAQGARIGFGWAVSGGSVLGALVSWLVNLFQRTQG